MIYRGVQNEDLKPYEELHKELRNSCAKWKKAKDIAKCIARLDQLDADIVGKLRKFADMERVRGHCDLCSN